jgi:hypothetical protein
MFQGYVGIGKALRARPWCSPRRIIGVIGSCFGGYVVRQPGCVSHEHLDVHNKNKYTIVFFFKKQCLRLCAVLRERERERERSLLTINR